MLYMLLVSFDLLLIVNMALLLLAFLIAVILLRLGVLYVRAIGDKPKQRSLRKVILTLIMMLLVVSLTAAAFNILIGGG